MKLYRAKLKSRQQIMAEIPREQQGWWADVCPGETLTLRDATEYDLARCIINEGNSRDPADYLCENFERGALVKRIAVAELTLLKNCYSCQYLEYECGDYESQTRGGFVCEKRDPETEAGQIKLEKNMQSEPYRGRYKRCFELKEIAND